VGRRSRLEWDAAQRKVENTLGENSAKVERRNIIGIFDPPLDFSRIHLHHISPDCLSGFVSARI
jgi:hypothetical protein